MRLISPNFYLSMSLLYIPIILVQLPMVVVVALGVCMGYVLVWLYSQIRKRFVGMNELSNIRLELSRFVQQDKHVQSLFPPTYLNDSLANAPMTRKRSSVPARNINWLAASASGIDEVKRGLSARIELAATSAPSLAESLRYTLLKPGKMVRSRLAILLGQSLEIENRWEQLIELAQVVELEHAASLLHDDVVDDASTRRGLPSHRTVFGDRTAVLTGDTLVSILVDILTKIGIMDVTQAIGESMETLVMGELLQLMTPEVPPPVPYSDTMQHLLFPRSVKVEIDEKETIDRIHVYLRKSFFKTASLFAALTGSVGTIADVSAVHKSALCAFGFFFGLAFQLIDDVLDLDDTDTAQVGKPVGGSDIRNGTVTIPVLLACLDKEGLADSERNELVQIVRRRFRLGGDCERTVELLVKSNGIRQSRTLIRYYLGQCRMQLSILSPVLTSTEPIEQLLHDYENRRS